MQYDTHYDKHIFSPNPKSPIPNPRIANPQSPIPNPYSGFTLIELVMVITIILILAFSIIPKYLPFTQTSQETSAIQVESYIRYTQAMAMGQYAQKSVAFNSDAQGWYFTIMGQTYYIASGVSFSYSGTITFNSLGEPTTPIGTVSVGSITITVEPVTGKVKRV